jgi:hypothetical protein
MVYLDRVPAPASSHRASGTVNVGNLKVEPFPTLIPFPESGR